MKGNCARFGIVLASVCVTALCANWVAWCWDANTLNYACSPNGSTGSFYSHVFGTVFAVAVWGTVMLSLCYAAKENR